jgi:hypothetical protein
VTEGGKLVDKAWPILSSTFYLALLLTALGGSTVWWSLRRALAGTGLFGKKRRRYRRKEKDGTQSILTPVRESFLGLDLAGLFALWVGLAVLAGGLYGLNAVWQDISFDKEKASYLCLNRTVALPGGQTAVYLASLPNQPELTLFDERGITAGLKRAETYRVLYYPNTRLLISIE